MRDVRSWVTTLPTVALASTWLSACSSTVAGGPCDGDSPAAACSQSCGTGAAACPTGFYCGTSGTCSADCGTACTQFMHMGGSISARFPCTAILG